MNSFVTKVALCALVGTVAAQSQADVYVGVGVSPGYVPAPAYGYSPYACGPGFVYNPAYGCIPAAGYVAPAPVVIAPSFGFGWRSGGWYHGGYGHGYHGGYYGGYHGGHGWHR